MGIKFREMGATSSGEASWSWAACFLLSGNFKGIKRNTTSTLGMAQLWEKWTISRKASGILHEAVYLRTGTTMGGYGNSSWGKWLRRFFALFHSELTELPETPLVTWAALQSYPESKISEWGWKGFWNKHPRTLLPFHQWGNWDSEGEMDLPKVSAPLMARGTKLWVKDLPWPAIPFHHASFVGSVVHLVLYKAPSSIHFPTDNLEGGHFHPGYKWGHWGRGPWRPPGKPMWVLGQELRFQVLCWGSTLLLPVPSSLGSSLLLPVPSSMGSSLFLPVPSSLAPSGITSPVEDRRQPSQTTLSGASVMLCRGTKSRISRKSQWSSPEHLNKGHQKGPFLTCGRSLEFTARKSRLWTLA